MASIGAKRKAPASEPAKQPHDAAAVALALKNAARIGATYATARSDAFPVPAIAFRGEEEADEALLAPLSRSNAQKIKARGVVSQRHNDEPVAWEVASDVIELQNPRWQVYLDKFVQKKRKRLGIASTATVGVKLNRLLLAEEGARLLERPSVEARGDGAFGRLLVVLPGTFTGGDVLALNFMPLHEEFNEDYVELLEEDEDNSDGYTIEWRRGEHGEAFDLMCVACHDCFEFEARPIESGAALCLVYDLVTTTAPTLVRFYGEPTAVQQAVNTALSGFFDVINVAPPQMAKRIKINPDLWPTIQDFTARRHFVYFVDTDNINDMNGHEERIAESLAAFCAQSEGEFVLYLSNVLCSRLDAEDPSSDDEVTWDDDLIVGERSVQGANAISRDGLTETFVTLTAPWTKFSEPSEKLSFPSAFLRDYREDFAPVGHLERLPPRYFSRSEHNDPPSILRKVYGAKKRVQTYATFALVVMPVSVERVQIAKLPVPDALERLYGLLSKSRDEALEYARRIVRWRPKWSITYANTKLLAVLLYLVVKIDDRLLFEELLQTLDLETVDEERRLLDAIHHFGFDACVGAIEKRVRSTPTLRGRVNLVLSVVDESLGWARIGSLLDVLLSLHPWADTRAESRQMRKATWVNRPGSREMRELLMLAHRLSPEKAIQVASVKDPVAMVQSVLPALTPRAYMENADAELLRDVLVHAYELFKAMKPEILNDPFTRIRLEKICTKCSHCATCDELQSFLLSTATERTMQCTNEEEKRHAQKIFRRGDFEGTAHLFSHDEGGLTLRLFKSLHQTISIYGPTELCFAARDIEKEVLKVLAPAEDSSTHDEE